MVRGLGLMPWRTWSFTRDGNGGEKLSAMENVREKKKKPAEKIN